MPTDHTTYSALLGTLLSSERKKRNLDQNDIAERMGLSQASYSRLEGGKAVFTVDQMFQAADALGIPQAEFNAQLTNTIANLTSNGVLVTSSQRGNSKGAEVKQPPAKSTSDTGTFLVGAALGAALISLLSNK